MTKAIISPINQRPYVKPLIQSSSSFERLALACNGITPGDPDEGIDPTSGPKGSLQCLTPGSS